MDMRLSERMLRHTCVEVKDAGATRNHRKEACVERGPFGLGVLHMDIDASWAGDQKNRNIYIPNGVYCPYCRADLKHALEQANKRYNNAK